MQQEQEQEQEQQTQPQNISREKETPELILRKLDTILQQSPNSIKNFLRKRNIDLATVNLNRNPLLKALQENYPINKIHALLKNFSSFPSKQHISTVDIEIVKN